MATVKTKFRASASKTEEGTLLHQVIHNRTTLQVHTGYKLHSREWDAGRRKIVIPPGIAEARRNYLTKLQEAIHQDTERLKSTISQLERTHCAYTAEEVVTRYLSQTDNPGFISYARNLIRQLRAIGKQCTADTYTTAVNSFARFKAASRDVPWSDMDTDLIAAYEAYLRDIPVCPNSISFYMRNLRAIYNRAADKGLTAQRRPFRHAYTRIGKTVKRAVPLKVIRRIRELDLSPHPAMDYARDIFMFSFYTRGMSFVDMAYLKKTDLQNGILTYRRRKTHRQLTVKWEKPMQELVSKYDIPRSPYLLPIIKDNGKDERHQYKSEAHRINRNLKKIGRQLGLPHPLTTYVARHGWASIAKSKNIPIATISEAMGHDSEATTRIYLATLDASVVDKANSLILKSL